MDDSRTRDGANPVGLLAPAVCFLIAILEGYDIQSFGIAAQRLAGDLTLNSAALGIAGSAATAGLVIGAVIGGMLSDRIGPKPVLLAAIALFGIFSLATALSNSYALLVLARLLTGIGLGGGMPNLIGIATRLRPEGKHIGLTTMIFCGMPAGGMLCAFVAQALGTPLPWRMIFVVGGILPLLLAPAAVLWLPSFAPVKRQTSDKGVTQALFGGGRALATILLWLAFFCVMLLLFLQLNWLPLLVVGKGFSAATGVSATLGFNLGGIVLALLLGRWADSAGTRLPLIVGTVLLLAGTGGMLLASSSGLLLAAAALVGAGSIGVEYLLYSASPMPYPKAEAIAAAGVAIGIGRLGSVAGPLLAGMLRQSGYSVNALLALLLPVALLSGLCGILALKDAGKARAPNEV